MPIKYITSLTNDYIKEIASLQQTKQRREQQRFLIEGWNMVNEAANCGWLDTIICLESVLDRAEQLNAEQIICVPQFIIDKITSTSGSVVIVGVCRFIESKIDYENNFLVLDDIQDPGNLGTLLRSAFAFGFKNVICSPNTVDYLNPKVLRATQGYIFRLNILRTPLVSILQQVKQQGYLVIGTNLQSASITLSTFEQEIIKSSSTQRCALLLGNEGHGVSSTLLQELTHNVLIETDSQLDSLNVGVAGSILMYSLRV